MQIEFEIDQQRLTRTSDAYLIEGSKNFVECIFSFSSDWAELDKWALFKRDNNTYEIYIEDNKCLVPIQCTSAEGEFTISVVGRKNAENVTGTASDKLLTVRGSEFVGGMGEEGRLTETYLVEVLGEVKDLREKAATSEANAAESAQNAKGYADKAKEYSESVNVYIPSVSQDGVMTWTNKAGLANPTPVNVKGERGEKGEQGAKGDTGATGAKGERGEQGPQGLQGAKGEKGEKGDAFKYTDFTAAQLAALKGPQGDRGLQGERGETGPRGATGPQGAKGDKGDAFTYADFTQEQLAGLKGPQGDKGLQGLQGERGERGLQGLQGIQGVKGDTGTPATVRIGTVETGAAGTSASVTNSGTASAAVFDFIIPKGDKGATGDRGPQGLQGAQGLRGEKGEKGDQGTGVTIKGKYDSLSALMAAHPTGKDGDAYMVGVNLYAWSGTEWIDCGNIQGAKGERGDRGPQGLQGAKGDKGETGEKGDAFTYNDFTEEQLARLKGAKGDKGDVGPQGPQGLRGEKGEQGVKGEQGLKGDTGPKGETGEQGAKGDTGTPATIKVGTVKTGAAGTSVTISNSGTASAAVFDFVIPRGDKGDTGPQGLQGIQGATGATGPQGDRGPQGLQGERGLQGLQGPKGNDGAAGAAGAAATIKVGVVTTGAAGTAAKVTNSGTTSAAVLDFVIPQGPKGDKGEQGAGSIVAVDSELSSTSTNPVQNKVVKAAIDTVKKNMSQGFQTVTDSIPTKVSALENDAEYLKKGANICVERYYTYVKSGTSDAPQVHVAQYTTSTGSFVIDLGYFTSNLNGGQSLVFTAYIQSTSDTAGTLTINNAGTIKYIGAASDLAITKAGLLLTVLMTKDWNDVVTSIVQASKLS